MANFTPFEADLSSALDEWVMRLQGLVLEKKNPVLFIQVLRSRGIELVKLGDLQKIRHDHKVITNEILKAYRELLAAKNKLELLQAQKDIIEEKKEENKDE